MKVLIAGYGSVGKAIESILNKTKIDKLEFCDPPQGLIQPKEHYDHVHICFPMIQAYEFTGHIKDLIQKFQPSKLFIHSTIVPGIITQLAKDLPIITIIYSPVRCSERNMMTEIKKLPLLYSVIGPYNDEIFPFIQHNEYFEKPEKKIYWEDIEALVLAKLMEVCWFGMEIAWVNQIQAICDDLKINFQEAYTKYQWYSRIGIDYTHPNPAMVPRPIFKPGIMGGKCVIPDTKLALNEKIGSPNLWYWILTMNEYMVKELDRKH
jgi:hypothetical protein